MANKLDLNQCTGRQLSAIPGIDESLADAIISTRRCRKKFQHIDQLWKVGGMTRAKFRILLKYTEVAGQTTPSVGTIPYVPSKSAFMNVTTPGIHQFGGGVVWKTPRTKSKHNIIEISGTGIPCPESKKCSKYGQPAARCTSSSPKRAARSPVPERPRTVAGRAQSRPTSSKRQTTKKVEKTSRKTIATNTSMTSFVEPKPILLPPMMQTPTGKGRDTPADKLDVSESGNRLTITYRFEDDRVNIPNTVILRSKSAEPKPRDGQDVTAPGTAFRQPRQVKDAWTSRPVQVETASQTDRETGLEKTMGSMSIDENEIPDVVPLSSQNLALHEAAISAAEETPKARQRTVESWVKTQADRPFRDTGPGVSGPKGSLGQEVSVPVSRRSWHSTPGPPAYFRRSPVVPNSGEVKGATGANTRTSSRYQPDEHCRQQAVANVAEYGENNVKESVPATSNRGQAVGGNWREEESECVTCKIRSPRDETQARRHERKRTNEESQYSTSPKRPRTRSGGNDHDSRSPEASTSKRYGKGKALVRGTAIRKSSRRARISPEKRQNERVSKQDKSPKQISPRVGRSPQHNRHSSPRKETLCPNNDSPRDKAYHRPKKNAEFSHKNSCYESKEEDAKAESPTRRHRQHRAAAEETATSKISPRKERHRRRSTEVAERSGREEKSGRQVSQRSPKAKEKSGYRHDRRTALDDRSPRIEAEIVEDWPLDRETQESVRSKKCSPRDKTHQHRHHSRSPSQRSHHHRHHSRSPVKDHRGEKRKTGRESLCYVM